MQLCKLRNSGKNDSEYSTLRRVTLSFKKQKERIVISIFLPVIKGELAILIDMSKAGRVH